MTDLTVLIDTTAGSRIEPDQPGTRSLPGTALTGRPVGHGIVPNTLDETGRPVDVLLLMHEPALPGTIDHVHPLAILHETAGGTHIDQILATVEPHSGEPTVYGIDDTALTDALTRLAHGRRCTLTGRENTPHAEAYLAAAKRRFEHLTGDIDEDDDDEAWAAT